MGQEHRPTSGDPPRRSRLKLAREIALTLAIKLVLIVAIKFAFFNEPVSKTGVAERMDAVFSTQPATPRPNTSPDYQRKTND